ncbi:MAG: LacI family DNA-binding transcriptional regulator [Pseudomonadota bacterium]
MAKRPTILDVARHAGVSKSTVSLVLQNSALVKDSTREKVTQSMTALNYVYNRSAAGLRGTPSGLIGLIINDLRNPFFTEFAASAQMRFAEAGYSTVIANADENPEIQAQVIAAMIEHGVSAFVLSPSYGGDAEAFDRIARAGKPAMQVMRKADDRTDLFPLYAPDFAHGGELATDHLMQLGCRSIAFVGGLEDRSVTAERMSGYYQVMAREGATPRVLSGRPTKNFGRAVALKFAEEPAAPEAAVCFSDLVALGMLSGFAEAGIALGRDFRLVGFDDIEDAATAFPPLSSIHCGPQEIGIETAETMLHWLDEGEKPAPERRTAVSLIARRSSLGSNEPVTPLDPRLDPPS